VPNHPSGIIWHMDSGSINMVLGESGHFGKTQGHKFWQRPTYIGNLEVSSLCVWPSDTAVLTQLKAGCSEVDSNPISL
jgi:hypothetical protein